MRDRVTIRMAKSDEGPLVASIYDRCGGCPAPWIDWSDIFPFWLVGEVDGTPSGIIMASPGKPFGRVDFLYTLPTLTMRQRAILSRDLGFAGAESCRLLGSSAVLSTISAQEQSWKRVAQRRGWQPICDGTFLVKRV